MKARSGDVKGRRAEAWAALFLRLKGYRILAARERTNLGEADLIALKGTTLAFVEVKFRPNREAGAQSIRIRQQRRIHGAARAFLARHPEFAAKTIRFDAVLIVPWQWPRHILNAWPASEHNAR